MRPLSVIVLLSGCQAPCGEILHEASPHVLGLSGVSGDTVSYTAAGRTQTTAITNGTALLTGLPPLTEVAYRILDGDGALVCEEAAMTWNLPAGLPQLEVTENDRDRTDPDTVLVGTLIGATSVLFAIDREGRWLWHHEVEDGLIAVDVHIRDGAILHNVFESEFTTDAGEIRWLDLAGTQTASLRTEGAHHVFEPTPDGSIAWPAVDIRDWYDEKRDETITIVGDRLMESAPDGTTRELFTVWDYEDPERHDQWSAAFYDQGFDWTHANGVHYSAERDAYLFSLGHVDAIYEIDRTTGTPLQRIDSDWVMRNHTPFAFQHDPHWTSDGTLMMMSYTDHTDPVAIEYTVNTEAERLVEVWSDASEEAGLTMLGQVRRLESGNVLVNYGGKGIIREITVEGEVVWEVQSPLGTWFGNVRVGDELF
ncbi:MAG: hypothetical protein ACI8RZ_002594 [Myxococcota bacterium]|jgi:hypothetical protein